MYIFLQRKLISVYGPVALFVTVMYFGALPTKRATSKHKTLNQYLPAVLANRLRRWPNYKQT